MSQHHLCPGWMAPLLVIPFRHWSARPQKLMAPYLKPGDTALDMGCGPGFFTLPMARMVGPKGRIIAADLQPHMLQQTQSRARRKHLLKRIELHQTPASGLGLDTNLDFILAANVIHELPDAARFFEEAFALLKPGSHCLVMEPKGHVKEAEWMQQKALARQAGFELIDGEQRGRSFLQAYRKPVSGEAA